MNDKVKNVLKGIIESFKSGNIPEAVAYASFPIPDIPASKWSFTNRTIMFLSGTMDARGFRQWKEADRWVRKGAKAIYILVPCFKKVEKENIDDSVEVLSFFKPTAVFKYEETEGKDLDYRQIELPKLPLITKAEEWGISVKAIPGNYIYRGYYSPDKGEIALATPEEKTFFHELAHVGHEKVKGELKRKQDPLQEIVAELSAQALCRIVGKQDKDTTGNSYTYIERYAKEMGLSPHTACLKVLKETEQVLNIILKESLNEKKSQNEMSKILVAA